MADPKPKGPVTLSKPFARRVGRVVKRVEASYQRPPDQRVGRTWSASPLILGASVTTAIPTGTLASPSTAGRVTVYRDDDVGGLAPAETGVETHSFHTLTASVPIGTTISGYYRAGFFWVLQIDCY